jgi:ribosome-binding protein aMBF1 (putative translation factor)
MAMTPKQSTVARALLGWTRYDLVSSLKGAISLRTVENFERAEREPANATAEALQKVYTANGITFDADGVNVRLAVKGRGRK